MREIFKIIIKTSLKYILVLLAIISFFIGSKVFAADHTVDLEVGYKWVNYTGKLRRAIAVNNQIPGPTLHFKQGDHVTINVHNCLDQGTSIHWHGVLVPWQMDGVVGVSQKTIPPDGVFHYCFTLHQSGTYWYHAHAGLQEQEGLYGAFIIDPIKSAQYHYNKDYVVVLSDWSNTNADRVFRNLKKDGDYFSPRFPLQPSLLKFLHDYSLASSDQRQKLITDYKKMQQMRMGLYDLSDVAYDAFLLNGFPCSCPWRATVNIGDVVRLRIINAAASTIYHVKIPGTCMKIVHVQGNDVQPYNVDHFTIAPAETVDVLVKIEHDLPYIIYAESIDKVGAAYGALVTKSNQYIDYHNVIPFPEPLPVTRQMMNNMMMSKMDHDKNQCPMDSSMKMSTEPTIIGDCITAANHCTASMTMGTKYKNIIAAVKTNDPNKPIFGVIKIQLFGYMGRYIWFINGLPEYKAKPIVIEPGKRYRIIFTNISMMRHPMHIHGHWFILRNGHGAYDPLLHTIEVAPGETIVADLDADASGQWFFHCHHLYHMVAGMARVFQYSSIIDIANNCAQPECYIANTPYINRPIVREDLTQPLDYSLINHPMGHPQGFYFASLVDIGADPFNNVQEMTFKGLYGGDYNKLELLIKDAELDQGEVDDADLDIFYWHLISQFWAIKAGVNYFYRPAEVPYWQPGIGIEGVMPYFIDTDVRGYFHSGNAKLDVELSRDTQISNNFFIRTSVRSILATKTVTQDQVGSGLNQMRYTVRPYYRIMPGMTVFSEFEHEQDYGAFKTIMRNSGDETSENTLTFGVTVLF